MVSETSTHGSHTGAHRPVPQILLRGVVGQWGGGAGWWLRSALSLFTNGLPLVLVETELAGQ